AAFQAECWRCAVVESAKLEKNFDVRAEIADLRNEIIGIRRQLILFTKIILGLGTLQGKQRSEIHIDDRLVTQLCDELYELERRRTCHPDLITNNRNRSAY